MCDSIVTTGEGAWSFFAKNSDREPGEPQLLQYSADPAGDFRDLPWLEKRAKYSEHSFRALAGVFHSFPNPWRALISRPSWMWGAEMGINEHGLAIGNEAVFSREKVPADGILGMDILRLALHNAKGAREGMDFITRLIEAHDQGGDGGYTSTLRYHNSFLLKDHGEAFVLETSGRHWASRRVENASISNAYSIRGDGENADPESRAAHDFKGLYEDRVFTFFSKGNGRQRFTSRWIARGPADVASQMALLRSHAARDAGCDGSRPPRRGMGSVCMHSGRLIRSETTASMIVDYNGGRTVSWLTGSPNPCVSLFKPYVIHAGGGPGFNPNPAAALACARGQAARSAGLVARYPLFVKSVRPLRDEYEREFARIVYDGMEKKSDAELQRDCRACRDMEADYIRKVDAVLHAAP